MLICLHSIYSCFCATMAEFTNCHRECLTCKAFYRETSIPNKEGTVVHDLNELTFLRGDMVLERDNKQVNNLKNAVLSALKQIK